MKKKRKQTLLPSSQRFLVSSQQLRVRRESFNDNNDKAGSHTISKLLLALIRTPNLFPSLSPSLFFAFFVKRCRVAGSLGKARQMRSQTRRGVHVTKSRLFLRKKKKKICMVKYSKAGTTNRNVEGRAIKTFPLTRTRPTHKRDDFTLLVLPGRRPINRNKRKRLTVRIMSRSPSSADSCVLGKHRDIHKDP